MPIFEIEHGNQILEIEADTPEKLEQVMSTLPPMEKPAQPRAEQPRAQIPENPEPYSVVGALRNTPGSYGKVASNVWDAVTNPEQLVEGMKALGTKEGWEAIGGHYKDRYGSVEQAARTAYDDPAGAITDLTPFGLPLRAAGMLPKMGAVGKAGELIDAVDPVNVAVKGAQATAANVPGIQGFPERTYETDLKMSLSPNSRYSRPEVRKQVIDTLLKNNIRLNEAGMNKLFDRIEGHTAELNQAVKTATDKGELIPMHHVLKNLMDFRRSIGDPATNPLAAQHKSAVTKYMRDWLRSLGQTRNLTPQQVLELRRNLDAQINWNSVPTTEPPINRQITQEASHGARNALREQVEGYTDSASQVSNLLDAAEPAQRAANRLANNNQIPLRNTITGTAGLGTAAMSENIIGQLAGLIMAGGAAAWTPGNKQRAALMIYRAQQIPADMKRNLISALGLQTGRAAAIAGEPQEQMNDGNQ